VSDASRELVSIPWIFDSAKTGPHFLSTTLEQDEVSYSQASSTKAAIRSSDGLNCASTSAARFS
jgi:hypothetical protein